jgi:hypothetical protein
MRWYLFRTIVKLLPVKQRRFMWSLLYYYNKCKDPYCNITLELYLEYADKNL